MEMGHSSSKDGLICHSGVLFVKLYHCCIWQMGLLLALQHSGSTLEVQGTWESCRGEKAGRLQHTDPCNVTDPHSEWWSAHGLSAPSRTCSGAIRLYFCTLNIEFLLWQGWVFIELLGSFVLAIGYLSWALFQPFCYSWQNAVRASARLAAQAVAICVTIPFKLLNWTSYSHMGNLLQKVSL